MWSAILATILALLKSKKACLIGACSIAGIAAAATNIATWTQVADYMKPLLLTYVGAQGLQDGLSRLGRK